MVRTMVRKRHFLFIIFCRKTIDYQDRLGTII
jgi:hypothetical protein